MSKNNFNNNTSTKVDDLLSKRDDTGIDASVEQSSDDTDITLPVRMDPSEEIFNKTWDIGTKYEFQGIFRTKEEWFFVDDSSSDSIIEERDECRSIKDKLSRNLMFGVAPIRDNVIFKTIVSLFVFIFGGFDILFKHYLVIAFLEVFFGIIPDAKNKKSVIAGIRKRGVRQVGLLIVIAVAIHISDMLGLSFNVWDKSLGGREAFIIFFAVTNTLQVFKYGESIGIKIPQSWLDKIKAIKEQI